MKSASNSAASFALPKYFTGMEGHETAFASGVPMLMYHKLRSPPFRARMRGIYLSPKLFTRHLAELHQAGYKSGSLDQLLPVAGNPERVVIISFDDGYTNVLENGLASLEKFGFKAIQFLVPNHIGGQNDWDVLLGEIPEKLMDAKQVRDWLAAGHQIGAHTLSHPNLTKISESQAREEIFASKKKLEDQFGVPVEHFCYPYGKFNPRIRDIVEEAGYKTACTTDRGVNTAEVDRLKLFRVSTRYPSRNFKNFWRNLFS